jgi:ubiquinone/menaquinone biosynthesis C-methylase UbiE
VKDIYIQQVGKEISRLNAIGWRDFPIDLVGVRRPSEVDISKISYPTEAYDLEGGAPESDGQWAQHRAKKIGDFLCSHGLELMWEIGAGVGNVAIPLRERGIAVIPIEPLRKGAERLAKSGFHAYCATLDQLNLPDDSIDVLGIFDVLEHLENPQVVLSEIRRVLKPGGFIVTTVPANPWLFSDYDISIGHFRRYSRKSLVDELSETGFKKHRIDFMFFLFILPSFILRTIPYKLGRVRDYSSVSNSSKHLDSIMRILDPVLKFLLMVESKIKLPAGLSIISISTK